MRALRLYPDGLRLEDVPRPEPGRGEVLVRVLAAAITRNELTWPTDRLPAIPSYELAGIVEISGEEVIALTPFDRDGVAADYAVVPESVLAPKPADLSQEEAAALPMPALTAWQGLVIHGRLQAGERVLVTGAGGGVGHVAAQLVRALGGVLVTEGEACDLLFDTSGGNSLVRNALTASRVITIAAEVPGTPYFVVEPDGEQLASLPALQPQIDSVFPLENFQAAFDRSEARGKHGKIVIRVSC